MIWQLFVGILVQMITPKRHFEINWPSEDFASIPAALWGVVPLSLLLVLTAPQSSTWGKGRNGELKKDSKNNPNYYFLASQKKKVQKQWGLKLENLKCYQRLRIYVCTLNKSKAALHYNFSPNYYKILGQHEKESAVI